MGIVSGREDSTWIAGWALSPALGVSKTGDVDGLLVRMWPGR